MSNIPKKMKALRVVEYGKPYALEETDVPADLGPHDLLVKIAVASRCHTDGMVQSGVFGAPLPCTGSHEGAGTVVSVGSEVTQFKPGDRVMCGLPMHQCGACDECTGPETNRQYCPHVEGHLGVHLDGCFAEYARVDSRPTTLVPNGVSLLSAAPLACAGRTAWRAVLLPGLEAGQWLAITGSGGGLGHLAVQFAKARGLRVVGIDARDGGLALTKEMGADVVADIRRGKEAVVKQVQEATGGKGADATVNLADHPDAAALACAVTRMHGTMIQIAQPDVVKIPFQEFVFRDIRVRSSVLCSPEESRQMLEFVAEKNIKVRTVPFEGLDKVEELMKAIEGDIQGKAAIVVDPSQL